MILIVANKMKPPSISKERVLLVDKRFVPGAYVSGTSDAVSYHKLESGDWTRLMSLMKKYRAHADR